MSEALSYYKWFWRDWRSNRKVQRMGYVAKGLYRELLDEVWAEGALPTSMEELADICGCPVDVMTEAWKQIGPCFQTNEQGHFINAKMESVRTESDRLRVQKAQSGRLGALAKLKHTPAKYGKGKQPLADAGTRQHALADAIYADADADADAKADAASSSPPSAATTPDPVEEIYKAYPRKIGKQAALKAIAKAIDLLAKREGSPRKAQVFLFKRTHAFAHSPAGQDGEYTPHPATWFNRGSFDDDPAEWQRTHSSSERGGVKHGQQGRNGVSGQEMSRILDSLGGSASDNAIA